MIKDIDIVVAGYPSLDRIIKVKDNPRFGITSIVQNCDNGQVNYGGCSINIAYLGARLGLSTLPVLRVGCDYEGVGLKEFLQNGGVNTEGITVVNDDYTSNCYLIENSDGNHITLFYPGAMDKKYYKEINGELLEKAKYAVITVGCLEENWDFLKAAKKTGTPIVTGMKCDFEAFPEEFLRELLYSSYIIFANEGEQKEIEGKYNLSHISELLETGNAGVIVITKGCNGSEIYYMEDNKLIKKTVSIAKPDKIKDSTGVGDAYITGFLYGLTKGKSFEECGQYGAVASSFIIEEMGCLSGIPTIKNYENRVIENY